MLPHGVEGEGVALCRAFEQEFAQLGLIHRLPRRVIQPVRPHHLGTVSRGLGVGVACGVWRVACGVWCVVCGGWRSTCGGWRLASRGRLTVD